MLESEISTLSTTTVSVVSDVDSVGDSTFCFIHNSCKGTVLHATR